MDERFMTILKEVAQEHTEENDFGDIYCTFCSGDRDYDTAPDYIAHKTTCATLLARAILREMGQPLRAYCVEYEYVPGIYMDVRPSKNARRDKTKQYTAAYSEDEARDRWKHNSNCFNVQATYVRDL